MTAVAAQGDVTALQGCVFAGELQRVPAQGVHERAVIAAPAHLQRAAVPRIRQVDLEFEYGGEAVAFLMIPVTLQKSPLALPDSDAVTATAASTVAPPVGRPMAEVGIVKPLSDAHSVVSRVAASSAHPITGAIAITAQTPAPKTCFRIAFLMDRSARFGRSPGGSHTVQRLSPTGAAHDTHTEVGSQDLTSASRACIRVLLAAAILLPQCSGRRDTSFALRFLWPAARTIGSGL